MRTDVWQMLHTDLEPGIQPDGETFAASLGDRMLLLPIRTLADGRQLASLIINQASFSVLDALCNELAKQLARYEPDVIVGVPTLGLSLAEGVARRLGHQRYVPLGTSAKFWYDSRISVPLSSITTPSSGKRLYIDPRMVPLLSGRVAVVDDVISSGASMAAAMSLLDIVDVRPTVIGAAMLQGDAWRPRFQDFSVVGAFSTMVWSEA